VGGTKLRTGNAGFWKSESAWRGSGNGCSLVLKRPTWQTGVGKATCNGRAVPDVSADADPATGAYVYYAGSANQIGGTSLSTPLWAGMLAVWNRRNATKHVPRLGFVPPLLYQLANDATAYARDFHDVKAGSAGGHVASAGWDEATGWGSPKLGKLEQESG
jgi:kumamolisin